MTAEQKPDRRIFLVFWVSGEAYSSAFFEYRGQWMFRLHIKHATCNLLLKRLQDAGVIFLSTNESAQIRQWRKVDVGIEFDKGSKTPEVKREINGTIAFHFTQLVGPGCAIFDVEYKGKVVCSGSIDRKAESPTRLLNRLQKMGVRIYAKAKIRRMLEENGYDLGINFNKDESEGKLFQ